VLLPPTTTHRPATDPGFPLHERPGRVRSLPTASGTAHVFHPRADEAVCPAALLLEVDPVGPVRGPRGPVRPGVKVRGREYQGIVYGPDYTETANLDRLRRRSSGGKRSLALREYALGLEGLRRAAAGEPPWRVHGCVFAVLALESEPVDPRL
jgi:hypothetical protein